MKSRTVNYGESVRARLLSFAKKEGVQLEYILLRYALERFLYRLGKSRYVDTFILKGASAFAVWLGPLVRVTRDADMEVGSIHAGGRWIVRPLVPTVMMSGSWHFAGRSRGMCL